MVAPRRCTISAWILYLSDKLIVGGAERHAGKVGFPRSPSPFPIRDIILAIRVTETVRHCGVCSWCNDFNPELIFVRSESRTGSLVVPIYIIHRQAVLRPVGLLVLADWREVRRIVVIL